MYIHLQLQTATTHFIAKSMISRRKPSSAIVFFTPVFLHGFLHIYSNTTHVMTRTDVAKYLFCQNSSLYPYHSLYVSSSHLYTIALHEGCRHFLQIRDSSLGPLTNTSSKMPTGPNLRKKNVMLQQ